MYTPVNPNYYSDIFHDFRHIDKVLCYCIFQTLRSLEQTAKTALTSDDDDKPSHSYIALISMAILSTKDKKMLLCDIYQYVMDNFRYYNNKEKAWRNSIRHNLSLNECFIKNGRADNGKGNYWSIHPACESDFAKGDYRRRQARRRARKSAKENHVSDASMNYRYSVGYVPMTSSHIGYHPYSMAPYAAYPQTSYPCATQPESPINVNIPDPYYSSPASQYSSTSPVLMQSHTGYPQTSMTSQPGCYSSPFSPTESFESSSRLNADQAVQFFSSQALASQGLQHQTW